MMLYCFIKRCYDDEEQFKQCLHFARWLFEVSRHWLSDKEALVVECTALHAQRVVGLWRGRQPGGVFGQGRGGVCGRGYCCCSY